MREALFILLVMFALAALTAFRYRKQIMGIIGFANTLKELRKGGIGGPESAVRKEKGIALVNCSQCGVWVPRDRAIKSGNALFCSAECLKTPVVR